MKSGTFKVDSKLISVNYKEKLFSWFFRIYEVEYQILGSKANFQQMDFSEFSRN